MLGGAPFYHKKSSSFLEEKNSFLYFSPFFFLRIGFKKYASCNYVKNKKSMSPMFWKKEYIISNKVSVKMVHLHDNKNRKSKRIRIKKSFSGDLESRLNFEKIYKKIAILNFFNNLYFLFQVQAGRKTKVNGKRVIKYLWKRLVLFR